MADNLMGKTEVDAVSEEIVSSLVQDYLIQEALLLPTVMDYSALAMPGADKIKIPKAGGFTVGDKAENTAVDAQALTYTTDDLNLDKHKVIQVLAEDFAMLQSKVAAVRDIAMRAGKGLGLQLDIDIITALTATSSSAPDHRIAFANTTSLGEVDVLEARRLLNVQNVPKSDRFWLITPDDEKSALQIPNFVQADRYGDRMTLVTGELGQAYGFRFITHNNATRSVAYHKSHVAVAIQQALRYKSMDDIANLAVRHSFDQVYGVKTLDGGKRGVEVGSAT